MQVERWATTSDALSNQPGNPTSILRVSGLPSPCTEQPVLMKAAGLHQQKPAGWFCLSQALLALQPVSTWAPWLRPMSFPVGG